MQPTAILASRSSKSPQTEIKEPLVVHVLVADSGPLQSQLLTRALRARREFQVWPFPSLCPRCTPFSKRIRLTSP